MNESCRVYIGQDIGLAWRVRLQQSTSHTDLEWVVTKTGGRVERGRAGMESQSKISGAKIWQFEAGQRLPFR